MKAEEYIKSKSTILYSGGMNEEKVVSQKDALLALDAARNEMLNKVYHWLRKELYISPQALEEMYNANRVYQPF